MQSTQSFAVVASNVSKKYGKQEVLKNINLKINIGDFYVLMGPNGSGKTTLTSILASVKLPTTGTKQEFLEGLKKADEKLKDVAKPLEGEKAEKIIEKIKKEEESAESGLGSIFG